MNVMSKNKKIRRGGFTLLEMVLVMAIMVIMSAYLYATFKVVNYSHLEVTVVNDMHDYASLNLQAIANNLCNATSIGSGSKSIALAEDGNSIELNSNPILPGFTQYHTGNGTAKWGLTLTFTSNPDAKTVTVELAMTDNAVPESGVVYRDSVTVYCPGCTDTIDELGDDCHSLSFSTDPIATPT
ncbi:MAG: type II secretion system protein [Clostridiales bacterium]|nr:type II secretion system protein [Clostridiales bacterium]